MAERYPQRRDRFVTIRNGAPVANMDERPGTLERLGVDPGRYILCVGRLDPTKRFHDAVEAFTRARPPGMKLVVVGDALGDTAYAATLKAMASADVIFAGARSAAEVRALYRHASLFLHPSGMEGFAIVVLEALCANIPILVSDIAPHREVGMDAANYYPVGNIPALADALAHPPYAGQRCSRRAAILEENDWETVARRHREILLRPAVDDRVAREHASP